MFFYFFKKNNEGMAGPIQLTLIALKLQEPRFISQQM